KYSWFSSGPATFSGIPLGGCTCIAAARTPKAGGIAGAAGSTNRGAIGAGIATGTGPGSAETSMVSFEKCITLAGRLAGVAASGCLLKCITPLGAASAPGAEAWVAGGGAGLCAMAALPPRKRPRLRRLAAIRLGVLGATVVGCFLRNENVMRMALLHRS